MSRIFRATRRTLLAEGKTLAYLKYAVGEILLIVIGILIALQVNDWNDTRHKRIRERQALERLHAEAVMSVQYLATIVEEFDRYGAAQEAALAALSAGDWERVKPALMREGLGSLSFLPMLSPPSSAYEDLISSGLFGELTDTDVRTRVAAYHASLRHALGQLEYIRASSESLADARAESGGYNRVYDPAADRRTTTKLDLPVLAGNSAFMDASLLALSGQRMMQNRRLETLARAREMCESLGKAVDKPC
jgi:hypothetical protein